MRRRRTFVLLVASLVCGCTQILGYDSLTTRSDETSDAAPDVTDVTDVTDVMVDSGSAGDLGPGPVEASVPDVAPSEVTAADAAIADAGCSVACTDMKTCVGTTCSWLAILDAVNAVRAKPRACGSVDYPAAPPLTHDARIEAASLRYSKDAASKGWDIGMLGPNGSDGSTPSSRLAAEGYVATASFQAAGVADGTETPTKMVADFMVPSVNCAAIMSGSYSQFAFSATPGSKYPFYVTMLFARPK